MTNSPDTPEPALEGIGISKAFDQLEVLREVTIRVEPGEFLAVVGPNGAGKTTWCNIVSGFERQTAGNVRLSGRSVDRLRPHERYHRGIARTFQTPRIVDALTLEENVALAVRGRRGEAIGRARRFLRELGVPDVSRAGYDATLYERRVVELGRATINEPAVVILDEPLAGLRQPEHEIILGMARRLADAGSAVVIIEHLIPTIAPVVDRMVVLANTVLLADGTPADVLKLPEVIDAYLGQPMKVEVSG